MCRQAIQDEISTCVICEASALEPTPAEGLCECGKPFHDHNGLCEHGRSFFLPYRPVSDKDKAVIDLVADGVPKAEAYVSAGLPPVKDPEASVDRILKKPQNVNYISQILDDAGVTDQAIAEVIADAMAAVEIKIRKAGKDEDGNEQIIRIPVADHKVRLQAARQAADMKGHTAKAAESGSGGRGVIRIYSKVNRNKQGEDETAIEINV